MAGTGLVACLASRVVCVLPLILPLLGLVPWLPEFLPRPPGLASVGWKCQLALLVRGWAEQEASAREGCSVVAG